MQPVKQNAVLLFSLLDQQISRTNVLLQRKNRCSSIEYNVRVGIDDNYYMFSLVRCVLSGTPKGHF